MELQKREAFAALILERPKRVINRQIQPNITVNFSSLLPKDQKTITVTPPVNIKLWFTPSETIGMSIEDQNNSTTTTSSDSGFIETDHSKSLLPTNQKLTDGSQIALSSDALVAAFSQKILDVVAIHEAKHFPPARICETPPDREYTSSDNSSTTSKDTKLTVLPPTAYTLEHIESALPHRYGLGWNVLCQKSLNVFLIQLPGQEDVWHVSCTIICNICMKRMDLYCFWHKVKELYIYDKASEMCEVRPYWNNGIVTLMHKKCLEKVETDDSKYVCNIQEQILLKPQWWKTMEKMSSLREIISRTLRPLFLFLTVNFIVALWTQTKVKEYAISIILTIIATLLYFKVINVLTRIFERRCQTWKKRNEKLNLVIWKLLSREVIPFSQRSL